MFNPIKFLFLVFSWAMAFGMVWTLYDMYRELRVEAVKAYRVGPMSLKRWNDKLIGHH